MIKKSHKRKMKGRFKKNLWEIETNGERAEKEELSSL